MISLLELFQSCKDYFRRPFRALWSNVRKPRAARTFSPLTLGWILTALTAPLPLQGCYKGVYIPENFSKKYYILCLKNVLRKIISLEK